MAQVINLREDEYQTLVEQLVKMHANQLQNVTDVINEMRALVTSDEVFSANMTSKKIEDMLDMLSSDVITLLEQVFHDCEIGIGNMIKNTLSTDGICG